MIYHISTTGNLQASILSIMRLANDREELGKIEDFFDFPSTFAQSYMVADV